MTKKMEVLNLGFPVPPKNVINPGDDGILGGVMMVKPIFFEK